MSTVENNNIMSKCAACGNDGDGLKTCNACKLVKYCNATCQKTHRLEHKKECKRRAAEIFDEALFKQPPPRKECPICFLPLPRKSGQWTHQLCCGKIICMGCIYGVANASVANELCPFCRAPTATSEEEVWSRLNKRVEANDSSALYSLGGYYADGMMGYPQDHEKAIELWLRSGELGHPMATYNIANAYLKGCGVEIDMKKANHYWELAALRGDEMARHNLASIEERAGNMSRAMKHLMIAAGAGYDDSLTAIRQYFMHGYATKNDFEKALRAHKEAKDSTKSDQRAAALADQKFMRTFLR